MQKLLPLLALSSLTLFAQFKVAPAGPPPAESSAVAGVLAKSGIKVNKADGSTLLEIWLVAQEPTGGALQDGASLPGFPIGALLGVVRFPAKHADRRGQTIQPGVYTLRYGVYPVNGDHQGVAPQRDFAVLSPAAADTDPKAQPDFATLMGMSKKASGTPHPLVLSIWKDDAGAQAGTIELQGESDQVVHTKLGATPLAIIVVGKYEA
jgi:hypothetical protein